MAFLLHEFEDVWSTLLTNYNRLEMSSQVSRPTAKTFLGIVKVGVAILLYGF